MNNNFKYFEEMGSLNEISSSTDDSEITVDFCKCSECQSEFMLDEGETIDSCPDCGTTFDHQGDKA